MKSWALKTDRGNYHVEPRMTKAQIADAYEYQPELGEKIVRVVLHEVEKGEIVLWSSIDDKPKRKKR